MIKFTGKKGAALVATLFAVVIVLTLGFAFIILSISENKAIKADMESTLALQTAKSGIELLLCYMGSPCMNNLGDQNNPVVWEYESDSGSKMEINEVLKAYSSGNPVNFRPNRFPPDDKLQLVISRKWNTSVVPNRYDYDIEILPDRKLGRGLVGHMTIKMQQTVFGIGQPPTFIATSTGSVYNTDSQGKRIGNPIASRQVEVRFREETAQDNLIFVQNHAAYDVVGNLVSPPNNFDGSDTKVGIFANYTCNGSIVIDGGSNFAKSTAGFLNFFSVSGVNFFGNVLINGANNVYDPSINQSDRSKPFKAGLYKGQPSKGLPDKSNYMNEDRDGNGSLSAAEQGRAFALASDTSGGNYVKAVWKCGDNDGLPTPAGLVGHSKGPSNAPNKYYPDPPGTPENQKMSVNVPSDIEFDGTATNKTPGFAKFIVEFTKDGKVSISKVTAYTGTSVNLLRAEGYGDSVSVDRFKNGILYFEGGNVEVKGTFKGQLTIVCAESPYREAYAYDVVSKDNPNTAKGRQYVFPDDYNNDGKPEYSSNPDLAKYPGKYENHEIGQVTPVFRDFSSSGLSNSDTIYTHYNNTKKLPYSADATGKYYKNTFDSKGNLVSSVVVPKSEVPPPPYYIGGKWIWPSDWQISSSSVLAKETGTGGKNNGLFSDTEREGNIILAGDLQYTEHETNALGLIAKNWILLNDIEAKNKFTNNNLKDELNARGVLMSFDHSVQFDDVNLARRAADLWYSKKDMNGLFNFMGSLISQYSDVEGKTDGTGYTRQNFQWDPNLKHCHPPHFPRWDKGQMSKNVVLRYVILGYQDKGAVKVQ